MLCAGKVTPVPGQRQQVPTESAWLLRWASKQLLVPLRERQSHMAKLQRAGAKGFLQHTRWQTGTSLYSGRWQAWRRQPSSREHGFGLVEVPKPTSSLLIRVKEFTGLVWHLRCCEGQSFACSLLVTEQQACGEPAAEEVACCSLCIPSTRPILGQKHSEKVPKQFR